MTGGPFYLGIDVGTGSARAAIFDARGVRAGLGTHPLRHWQPQPDFHEQSSDDIWQACGQAVRAALAQANVPADSIRSVGFDATCSLVALGPANEPVTISPDGDPDRNVILWMDHRATPQAARINASHHPALRFTGGVISPEMELPKLLWIKEHLPHTWQHAARFLDLADFLTYRATGHDVRSVCTTTCKWAYRVKDGGWDDAFLAAIGLDELTRDDHARIGSLVRPPGEYAGELTSTAAMELGLAPGAAVAVSMIDAHAGGIGVLGMGLDDGHALNELERRVALIGGSSSCHMAVAGDARFVPGVWGPYFSAMVPDLWLAEGGQSATGLLVDHVIHGHERGAELAQRAEQTGTTVYQLLNDRLADLSGGSRFPAELTRDLHVYPDFHGNRSPLADPTLRGMISGLALDRSTDALALLYLATIQAIALGTRQIIAALNDKGYRIDTIVACGGGTKNDVFLREHADATGCRVLLPEEPEAVLLGAAILGAVACSDQPSIAAAMSAMSRPGRTIEPAGGDIAAYHDAKWDVHQAMLGHQRAYSERMRA